MKILNLLLLIILLQATAFAQSPQDKFQEANTLYSEGKYSSAIDIYESLINSNYQNAEIYFNLGNAYYKLDDVAYAILNYERAKKLAPGDEDIDYNLRIANLKTIDKIEPVPEFFLNEWWSDLVRFTDTCNWAYVFIASFWLAFLLLAGFYMAGSPTVKKLLFAIGTLGMALSILIFVVSFQSEAIRTSESNGIVITPKIRDKTLP